MLRCSYFITEFFFLLTIVLLGSFKIKRNYNHLMAFFQKQVISKIFLNIEYSAIQVSEVFVRTYCNKYLQLRSLLLKFLST